MRPSPSTFPIEQHRSRITRPAGKLLISSCCGTEPVGVGSRAVAVGEDAATIEEVHEPFLILQGFLQRTPRGRIALPAAYTKIGATMPPPADGQPTLL